MRPWALLAALATTLACTGPARAGADCAPVAALPTYEAEREPDGRRYDAVILAVRRGDGVEQARIIGETCIQHYAPMSGTDALSDFQIQQDYREQLAADGIEILFTDDRTTVARRHGADGEIWIRIASQETAIDVTTIRPRARPQTLTAPGANDYRLLGHMPDYTADPPDRRGFDQRTFLVRDGEETREVTVQGARVDVDYTLRDGGRLAGDLEIHETYRAALAALGATIVFTDERNTVARLGAPEQAIWLKVWSQETAINLTVIEQSAHQQSLRPPSGHDHRLLGHMPGYIAGPPDKRPLDEVVLAIQDGEDSREIKVQGSRTDIAYAPAAAAMPASDLDIQTNYRNALASLGAQLLFTDGGTTLARLSDNGRLLWIKVWSQETAINLSFVEEKAFKSAIKPTPAETLRVTLAERGRAGLYIGFEFNRPTLRPQAEPILAEVVRLLRETPGLRLAIESHTDNIGPRSNNLALTAARAESVRGRLIAAGIDASRLTAVAVGPDRPLADNTTSEGRARNRRVVLVRQ